MTSDFERRWQRIQDQLRVQMTGDAQPRVSSGRTLFGIQSEGERKMDEFARQIEQEQAARRRERLRRENNGESPTENADGEDSPSREKGIARP